MTCVVCDDDAVTKGRCAGCYRYWIRNGRKRDRNLDRLRDLRFARAARREEIRVLVRLARDQAVASS